MAYEPVYEQFVARAPGGAPCHVEFRKAGILTAGDRPELYFFAVDGREVVVAISGAALEELQHRWRYLSREEKVDISGRLLHNRIEHGAPLTADNLFLDGARLRQLIAELDLPDARFP